MMLPFTAERLLTNWGRLSRLPTHQWAFMILEDPVLLISLWTFARNEPRTKVDNYRSVNQIVLALGMARIDAWLQKAGVMPEAQWARCATAFTQGFLAYQLVHVWLAGKQEDIPEEMYMACILGNMTRWSVCMDVAVPDEVLPEFVREMRDYKSAVAQHHDWTATSRRTHLVHSALRTAESLARGIPTPVTLDTWVAAHLTGVTPASMHRAMLAAVANNPGYVLDVLNPWVVASAVPGVGSTA